MAISERLTLIHIFVDHSNIWGGARGASRLKDPKVPDISARVSVRHLHRILGGERQGVSTKIVSGGIPPGMEGVWAEYQRYGYDTPRLVCGDNWKERGVDHTIIGHMWRLLAKCPGSSGFGVGRSYILWLARRSGSLFSQVFDGASGASALGAAHRSVTPAAPFPRVSTGRGHRRALQTDPLGRPRDTDNGRSLHLGVTHTKPGRPSILILRLSWFSRAAMATRTSSEQASSRSWRRFWYTWPLSIGTTQTTLVSGVRPHRG